MQNIDDKSLITVTGGAKCVPAAVRQQLKDANSMVADSEGTYDKARIGKGNVVEIHEFGGGWEPFSDFS
jgi:hypothetical protein